MKSFKHLFGLGKSKTDPEAIDERRSVIHSLPFLEAWLGTGEEMTPEKRKRASVATDFASAIAMTTIFQLALTGKSEIRQCTEERPIVLGYVVMLSTLVARAQDVDSTHASKYIGITALSLLNEEADDKSLLHEIRSHASQEESSFHLGIAAAEVDFPKLGRNEKPLGLYKALVKAL
jgi:hypothetical protein